MDELTWTMTIGRFAFLGCLIVRWLDPLAKTPQMRRYRGVERLPFSSLYLTSDAKPPAGRLGALREKFLRYEDAFEYLRDPRAAIVLYQELKELDSSYELIGCAIEERLVDELRSLSEEEIFGRRADQDERQKLEDLKLRLLEKPSAPPWPVLGYDICELGHYYSPVFHEVLPGDFPEYDKYITSAGLFSSPKIASDFLAHYRNYPYREEGRYYVHEVLAAPES